MKISIDPGKRIVSYAIFDGEELYLAGFVRGNSPETLAHALLWSIRPEVKITHGVIERPQIYRQRSQKGDQNDLIDVALVAGACRYAMHTAGVTMDEVLPREWKGQIPKRVTVARVDAELSAEERARITWPAKGEKHNVYDAIHIGLRVFTKRKA